MHHSGFVKFFLLVRHYKDNPLLTTDEDDIVLIIKRLLPSLQAREDSREKNIFRWDHRIGISRNDITDDERSYSCLRIKDHSQTLSEATDMGLL